MTNQDVLEAVLVLDPSFIFDNFSPLDDWRDAGILLEKFRIDVGPDQCGWYACPAHNNSSGNFKNPRHAICAAVISLAKYKIKHGVQKPGGGYYV